MVNFFRFLRMEQKLSLQALLGYRSALNKVFLLGGRDLTDCKVLSSVLQSFKQSISPSDHSVPEWDLLKVLQTLSSSPYEPLEKASLVALSMKTTFLLALASAKRVSELNALSHEVRNTENWTAIFLSPVPDFVAKTQDPSKDDPRFGTFRIPALEKVKGKRPVLCPVRAVKRYLKVTKGVRKKCKKLLLNPTTPDKEVSKSTLSFWLRKVILEADAATGTGKVKAHGVRSLSTSLAFARNKSLHQVLKAGTWTAHNTFTNAYLREFSVKYLEKFSMELGPVVAAQEILQPPPSTSGESFSRGRRK